jgi:hypothetical protein
MEQAPAVMIGILQGEYLADEDWNAQVARMKREALPVVVLRCDPRPVVLLEAAPEAAVLDLVGPLRAKGGVSAPWTVWCTVFTPDRGHAESFLLVTRAAPLSGRWILHFSLPRHQAVLDAIARTCTLGIVAAPEAAVAWMPVPTPELRTHLAHLRRFQHGNPHQGAEASCTNT